MIEATTNPKGFNKNACSKFPKIIATTERVVPQEGQGTFVKRFKKQVSKYLF